VDDALAVGTGRSEQLALLRLAGELDVVEDVLLGLRAEARDPWISPASAAVSRSSRSMTPSSSYSVPAVLGPTPSTLVMAAMSIGYSSRRSFSSSISPVSTYSTTFEAMASPTPSMSSSASSPSAARVSMALGTHECSPPPYGRPAACTRRPSRRAGRRTLRVDSQFRRFGSSCFTPYHRGFLARARRLRFAPAYRPGTSAHRPLLARPVPESAAS